MTDRIKLKKDIESEAVARVFKKPEIPKRRIKTEKHEPLVKELSASPVKVIEVSPVKLTTIKTQEDNEEV